MNNKYAVLSMDIEDWYHLDYFVGKQVDKQFSMMDGVKIYADLLGKYNVKTTFFVLSELLPQHKDAVLYLADQGHEIACHGKTHVKPMTMSLEQFRTEVSEAKDILEQLIGKPVTGYRAPCYSIDNARYDLLPELGFRYSSSRMDIPGHPLYGSLDLTGYAQPMQGVYEKDGFYEFALSTQKFLGKNIAVSGGGWIRLFPWQLLMRPLIQKYLSDAELYTLYIHPFELSQQKMPNVSDAGFLNHIRAHCGLGRVAPKIEELHHLLAHGQFDVTTFEALRLYFSEIN